MRRLAAVIGGPCDTPPATRSQSENELEQAVWNDARSLGHSIALKVIPGIHDGYNEPLVRCQGHYGAA